MHMSVRLFVTLVICVKTTKRMGFRGPVQSKATSLRICTRKHWTLPFARRIRHITMLSTQCDRRQLLITLSVRLLSQHLTVAVANEDDIYQKWVSNDTVRRAVSMWQLSLLRIMGLATKLYCRGAAAYFHNTVMYSYVCLSSDAHTGLYNHFVLSFRPMGWLL